MSLRAVPLSLRQANVGVQVWHRHHAPLPGGFDWFSIGAVGEGQLVGVAIVGRPTNRNNDDGLTAEVIRLATDGTANVPSFLLGCAARAARAVGASRIITYTLEDEGGASLRAAGWRREADGIVSWWTHPGSRTPAVDREHMNLKKVRWGLELHDRIDFVMPEPVQGMSDRQGVLVLS